MTRRAKYVGPHDEVRVFDSEQGVYAPPIATVKQGAWLPADVPARIRDELLARNDGSWSGIDQPATSTKDKE